MRNRHRALIGTAVAVATLLVLPGCRKDPEKQAWKIIRAMEKSCQEFSREAARVYGPLAWDKGDKWVRRLAALGRPAIEPALSYCNRGRGSKKFESWRRVLEFRMPRVLALMQDKAAIPDLTRLATDQFLDIYAIAGLRNLWTREHLGQITDMITRLRASRWVKWDRQKVMLVEVLGKFEGSEVERLLEGYLSDQDPAIRRGALRAIARSRDRTFLPVVKQMLHEDPDVYVRIAAAEVLATLGEEGGTQYLLGVVDGDHPPDPTQSAICALVRLKEKAAVPEFFRLLRHEDRWVREFANEGLKLMGTPEARRALKEAGPVPDVPTAVDHFKPVDVFTWM